MTLAERVDAFLDLVDREEALAAEDRFCPICLMLWAEHHVIAGSEITFHICPSEAEVREAWGK